MKRANPGLKQIVELLAAFDITEKQEILNAVKGLVDREITSSNDLTDDEVEFILEHLQDITS